VYRPDGTLLYTRTGTDPRAYTVGPVPSSGIYFVRITGKDIAVTRQVMISK
jgi:hypothetical protein